MPGRGSQTFQKRQKEQQRKEKQQEKFAKRLAAKNSPSDGASFDEQIAKEETTAEIAAAELRQQPHPVDGV